MTTPTRLGDRYELRGVLGRGGMAEVRDGWDIRLQRTVAVKLLHSAFDADTESRLRFQSEAHSAAALNHPNIVTIYDYGEQDGTPYIVMERLPGDTLADVLASGPLPQERVQSILADVLSALTVAHEAGVLHRDIKPANILFTPQGSVKVVDFGIAKTNANTYTRAGQIVGTLAYLSPERLAGRRAEVTDDLYAVGCIGYESVCGRKPFPHDELGPLTRAILHDTPPPIVSLCPVVAPPLARTIERALARDPQHRFVSAADMRSSLPNPAGPPPPPQQQQRPPTLVLTAPIGTGAPMGPASVITSPPTNRRRRVATLSTIAGIAACLLLAATLWVLTSPFGKDEPAGPTVPTISNTSPSAPLQSSTATTATSTTTTTSTEGPLPGAGNSKEDKGNKGNKGRGNGRH